MKNRLKVAILTLHRVLNYGSVCQAYATQRIFEKLGYNVEIIDYITEQRTNKRLFCDVPEDKKKNIVYKYIYIILRSIFILIDKYNFGKFIKKHLKLTSKKYISISDLEKDIPKADVYIAGSDQIWNSIYNEGIDRGFFLDFIKLAPRISFASSFGKTVLDEWEIEETRKYLNKFNALSVREKQAVDIINKMGMKAVCILDPTLQLPKEEWLKLASKRLVKNNYLLLYLLWEDNGATELARKIADEKGLILVKVSWEKRKPCMVDKLMSYRKVEDFLSLINYADIIVTNSFHGLAFSINFNRDFVVIPKKDFNSRLESLLEITGLSNRMVRNSDSTCEFSRIDYKSVNGILDSERKKAKVFLENALKDIN